MGFFEIKNCNLSNFVDGKKGKYLHTSIVNGARGERNIQNGWKLSKNEVGGRRAGKNEDYFVDHFWSWQRG